jgi:hypothetical protein
MSAARALIAGLSSLALLGCATAPPAPRDAAGAFVIERDLLGPTVARGEFRAVNGVRRGFTVHMNGAFDGRVFTLVEDFVYDDGERDRKTWRLTRVGPGRYVGVREDVVGEAVGRQDGDVFRLEYDIRMPGRDGRPGMKLRFRDVMALRRDGSVVNNATVGWWGFRVARVELVITKDENVAAPAAAIAREKVDA